MWKTLRVPIGYEAPPIWKVYFLYLSPIFMPGFFYSLVYLMFCLSPISPSFFLHFQRLASRGLFPLNRVISPGLAASLRVFFFDSGDACEN